MGASQGCLDGGLMQNYDCGNSEATTDSVTVSVSAKYLSNRSDPLRRRFLFSYIVAIANNGSQPVQLLTRRWLIRNGFGRLQVVEGVGVVGETPLIPPGGVHTYESFCPLDTDFGSMSGSYGMSTDDGRQFDAEIGTFSLYAPTAIQ